MTLGDIISFLFILALNPYGIVGIVIALLMVIFVVFFFGMEAVTIGKKLISKTFFCPFKRAKVEVKLRPSIFTYRAYDDVIKCSAFKDKVTCKKKCLDLQVLRT